MSAGRPEVPESEKGKPSKTVVPQTAKQKKGNKSKGDTAERYDYSRTEGPDLRDPRATGPPCRGHHQPMPFGRGSLSACIAGCVVFG